MRVVVVHSESGYGANYGVKTFLDEYIYMLGNMPFVKEVILVNMNSKEKEFEIIEAGGIRTINIPAPGPYTPPDAYYDGALHLLKLYIGSRRKLVFSFHTLNLGGFIKKIHGKFDRAKVVLTVHYLHWIAMLNGNAGLYEEYIRNGSREYPTIGENHESTKSVLEATDRIVCLSEETRGVLNRVFSVPEEKMCVILNGLRDTFDPAIDVNRRKRIRKRFFIGEDETVLLFVGRIVENKGLIPLLSAFARIVKKYPHCRLVLAGDIYESKLLKNSGNAWGRISFTGQLPQEEVKKLYSIADIGVFPSYYEECSCVGMEMMMHGLPVVASDGYSVKDMFRDGENCIVAPIEDYADNKNYKKNLYNKLCELIVLLELRKSIAKKKQEIIILHIIIYR